MLKEIVHSNTGILLIILFALLFIYTVYKQYKWRQLIVSTLEAIIETPKELEKINKSINKLTENINKSVDTNSSQEHESSW